MQYPIRHKCNTFFIILLRFRKIIGLTTCVYARYNPKHKELAFMQDERR